jgi:hypothetical protein
MGRAEFTGHKPLLCSPNIVAYSATVPDAESLIILVDKATMQILFRKSLLHHKPVSFRTVAKVSLTENG